ncbi:YigZ family protein [Maribacter algicola]|uniref:YigZ family protein n=1 Tax=Maribacter algicola TaxID=2498892 RepID=A0A426RH23_9FLAO|nr:YigZ family protein [Maribacter algicola]RRQ48278.1 YigZ family protein [Maribacter algicola]
MDSKITRFKTTDKPSGEVLFKEKKSKFFGYTFPITTEEEVKTILEELRKLHPTANHVCYAWQLGIMDVQYRANDDGEPNNSAGLPIYGQIQSFEVTNVLVAVARIFGGTKLGVGGLMTAYRETAKLALENSVISEKVLTEELSMTFEYAEMDTVMRFIKKNQLEILSQKLHLDCEIHVSVQKDLLPGILEQLKAHHKVSVQLPDLKK